MVKICHFSDWHGHWDSVVPEADLYIVTGDMLPNFPEFTRRFHIEERNEKLRQTQWLSDKGGLRQFLGNQDAPVVTVRGNHDFVDYGDFFGGEVFTINENSSRFVEYCGLKIGGYRGVPPINGLWSDELNAMERLSRISAMPVDLDVVVCHGPPTGILNLFWGCSELAYQVNEWAKSSTKPKLCCFGHIHECGGEVEEHHGIKFSNAACAYNMIDL